jgi:hypothetical protein
MSTRRDQLEGDLIALLRASRDLPADPAVEQQLARGFLRQIARDEQPRGHAHGLLFWLALGFTLSLVGGVTYMLVIIALSHLNAG